MPHVNMEMAKREERKQGGGKQKGGQDIIWLLDVDRTNQRGNPWNCEELNKETR